MPTAASPAKIGLLIFTANNRWDFSKRSYDSIRKIALQAEADGFDSIWLHLMFQLEPCTAETRRRLTEALYLYRGEP